MLLEVIIMSTFFLSQIESIQKYPLPLSECKAAVEKEMMVSLRNAPDRKGENRRRDMRRKESLQADESTEDLE